MIIRHLCIMFIMKQKKASCWGPMASPLIPWATPLSTYTGRQCRGASKVSKAKSTTSKSDNTTQTHTNQTKIILITGKNQQHLDWKVPKTWFWFRKPMAILAEPFTNRISKPHFTVQLLKKEHRYFSANSYSRRRASPRVRENWVGLIWK